MCISDLPSRCSVCSHCTRARALGASDPVSSVKLYINAAGCLCASRREKKPGTIAHPARARRYTYICVSDLYICICLTYSADGPTYTFMIRSPPFRVFYWFFCCEKGNSQRRRSDDDERRRRAPGDLQHVRTHTHTRCGMWRHGIIYTSSFTLWLFARAAATGYKLLPKSVAHRAGRWCVRWLCCRCG